MALVGENDGESGERVGGGVIVGGFGRVGLGVVVGVGGVGVGALIGRAPAATS